MPSPEQSIGARLLDADAIQPSKEPHFRAANNSSLSTAVSNGSARSVARIGRLFRRNKSVDEGKDTRPEETESGGAFNAAEREYDPSLFGEIRDSWVRRHMVARENDYIVRKPLSIRVFTWNVAGKKPPSDLERTIKVHLKPLISDCSVFAIGLQEAVKLNAENVGKGNDGPLEGSAILWESALSSALHSVTYNGAFRQLVCRQMMGIVLLVYVREELASACGTPRVCAVGTGLLGLMGNKGAVAASLRVHSSNVCFVCAHMASGSNATEARNLEYAQLLLRLSFPQPLDSASTLDRTLSWLPHFSVFFRHGV